VVLVGRRPRLTASSLMSKVPLDFHPVVSLVKMHLQDGPNHETNRKTRFLFEIGEDVAGRQTRRLEDQISEYCAYVARFD
jgi:hypothetical protein